MRIAACLGVKDEAELIEKSIAHLRRIGVDLIIAYDVNSTDGTSELIEKYRSDHDFWILRVDDQTRDEFETWTRAMLALIKSAGADWVIFLDADEFWIPATGSLKECDCLAENDVLSVPRFNIPMGAGGPLMPRNLIPGHYHELMLYVHRVADLRAHLENDPAAVWIQGVDEDKVMARPERIGTIEVGAHNVFPADSIPLRRAKPTDLFIAHLPFTTRSRFKRKVANIRKMLQAQEASMEGLAWHWRRWIDLADRGGLDGEYDRSLLTSDRVPELRRTGVIRTAGEIFEEMRVDREG
jgi:glycosyltransferase involved in cell wall biosynthesis